MISPISFLPRWSWTRRVSGPSALKCQCRSSSSYRTASGVPARMMQFGCAWTQLQKVSNESVAVACWMVLDAMTDDANAAATDLPSGSRPPGPEGAVAPGGARGYFPPDFLDGRVPPEPA